MKRSKYIGDAIQDQRDLDEFDKVLGEEKRKIKPHDRGTAKSSEPTRKELAQSFMGMLTPQQEEDLQKRMKPGKIYNANHPSSEGTGMIFVGGVRPPKPSPKTNGATRKSAKKTARHIES